MSVVMSFKFLWITISVESSAYLINVEETEDAVRCLTYMQNNDGERQPPCGTPEVMGADELE
mgnify:CR=1 FL=1